MPAVNTALQDAVPTGFVPCARVHGVVAPNEPVPVPDTANATVPAGVDAVPALPGPSTTFAVQLEVAPKGTVDELHETVVVVGRRFTTSVDMALPGPAEFVAVTVTMKDPALA